MTTIATSDIFLSYRTTVDTPDGPFTIIASTWDTGDSAVIASGWTPFERDLLPLVHAELRPVETVPVDGLDRMPDIVRRAVDAVRAYYAGAHGAPQEVPVVERSGEYTTAAWVAMRTIAPGRPDTYSDFARRTGNVKAVRAAASACSKNAAALFVPCHRVVRVGGEVGKFRWGSQLKEDLLDREAIG